MHSRPFLQGAAAAVGLLLLTAVQAQPAPVPRPNDPLDAKALVPSAAYRSAFTGYRAGGETPPASWKQANDTVTRIGGWRVYAREAGAAQAPASAPTQGAPALGPARPEGRGHDGKH